MGAPFSKGARAAAAAAAALAACYLLRRRLRRALGGLSRALPRTRRAQAALSALFFADPPYVERCVAATRAGRVAGFRQAAGGVLHFRGIPYARAARLSPPQPAKPWDGERCCLRFGPACPQPAFGIVRVISEGIAAAALEALFPPLPPSRSFSYGAFSEDGCLNLNVWTPGLEGGRPVLVFIHGGGFQGGSNVDGGLIDGAALSEQADLVVVSINYRIGPFGFLHFPAEGVTNLGIRDQIVALEWVRDNVRGFGGDPGNVTVCGESAGGWAAGTLLGCPRARGLFHGVICMSGATLATHSAELYARVHARFEATLAARLGGEPLTAARLRRVPAEELQAWMGEMQFDPPLEREGNFGSAWQPLRGDDIVPDAGPHANLDGAPPVLTGCMSSEWKLFGHILSKFAGPTDRRRVPAFVVPVLRHYFHRTIADDRPGEGAKWDAYALRLFDAVAAARAARGLPSDVRTAAEATRSVVGFEDGSHCLARDARGYSYLISGPDGSRLAGAHARDVALLFPFAHPLVRPLSEDLVGDPVDPACRALSALVVEAFASFARTKVPTTRGVAWRRGTTMHLCSDPAPVAAPTPEVVAFQRVAADIVRDLRVAADLPQLRGAD